MLLIDGTHERCRRREDFIDEDEDRLLRRELDTFPYYVDELADRKILLNMSLLSNPPREKHRNTTH